MNTNVDMDDLRDRDTLRLAMNAGVILLLIAVVAPFVVYAVPGVVGADHGLVVLSGSMEPKMSPGDAVIVREVPASEIEGGDIITFQRGSSDTPTTHRVIEKQQTESGVAYVTKGDANEDPDRGTVPHDRVVGEVIFVIPFIGHVIQFANTQVGFLALVLTPMVLFVLSELWELAKSVREPESGETSASDLPGAATTASASTGTEAEVEGDVDDADGSGGFTLTRSSVQLLLLVFALYVPYSGYVAYTMREAWSIATAVATIIAFLFCLVIYVASRGASSGDSTRSIDGVVRRGELPTRIGERTTIPLESVESLVQMALDRDDWVIYDEEQETYYMTRDDALYLHRAAPETDGGTAVGADDAASERDAETESTPSADADVTTEQVGQDSPTGGGET